jgi:hypothetical protein
MSNKKDYRIMKLKSGEEIITKVKGKTSKNEIIVERPMIFKNFIVPDIYGVPRDVKSLQNWLENTDSIKTKIPKDFIVSILLPSDKISMLYEHQKKKDDITPSIDDSNEKKTKIQSLIDEMLNKKIQEQNDNGFMESLLDSIYAQQENPLLPDNLEENEDERDVPSMITMTLFFHPEALLGLVESGIVDEKDVRDMIQHFNDKFSSKTNKNHPNYGNRLNDWSSNLNDYLDDLDDLDDFGEQVS